MAVAVRDFSRAQPSPDASYTLVLDELEGQVSRMEELAKQEQGGFLISRASAARRRALRRRVHHELLRHLVTVAQAASSQHPGLAERYTMPSGNATHEVFRTFARKMLEQGKAERELLVKYGLAEKLLDDLETAVDDLDASVVDSNQGRRAHVGARAELKAVSDEVMRLVRLLDGLNRYRFSGNAELRAAWESARNVVSGPSPAEEPAEDQRPTQGGEVRPAA